MKIQKVNIMEKNSIKLKNKSFRILLGVIILLAFAVRISYVINTPYTEKQHDLDLSYILTIYKTGNLPTSNSSQYYHPPLHQIFGAIFLHFENIFVDNITENQIAGESLQYLTLIYSMILLYVIYNIAKEMKFKKAFLLYIMFFTAFHPTLIILSGSLNNDNLCLLLTMWSILRLIKWYKKTNIKNTLLLAITTGLAVMTKTNGAIVSIPIIYIFLLKIYKELKKSNNKLMILKKYISYFFLFGIVSLPIGLWYHVRNYILFNQSIFYVLAPFDDALYVGNYNLFERFFPISSQIFQIYCHPYEDFNIPTYLIKCSLYGEFIWGQDKITNIYYVISIICNVLFNIFVLYCIIKNILNKNKRNKVWRNTLLILGITNIISFILLNLKLPYGCSMDFRYVVPLIFIQVFCFELQNMMKKNEKAEKICFLCIFELTLLLMLVSNMIIVFGYFRS